mmetsp:Transcript_31568/g.65945  ORF Transcript_31568/g.65945 Transcript_31568/m.65945 type:complete len:209 (-) Transcript_31568:853-1479(-)
MAEEEQLSAGFDDQRDEENKTGEMSEALQAEFDAETNPRRKCLQTNVMTVSFLAGVFLSLMCIGQIVGMVFQDIGPISYILRFYTMILCFLGILVELEWTKFVTKSTILNNWISRGFFYSFIGVLGLQENDSASLRDENRPGDAIALNYVKVVAWLMISIGLLYSSMGISCLQFFYNRQRTEYKRRLERAATIREAAARYGGGRDSVV